jgi:hypothetical protein
MPRSLSPALRYTYFCPVHPSSLQLLEPCCPQAVRSKQPEIEVFPGHWYRLGVYGYNNNPQFENSLLNARIWLARGGGECAHLGGPYPGGIVNLHEPILQSNGSYRIGVYVWEPYRGVYGNNAKSPTTITLNTDYLYSGVQQDLFPFDALEQAKKRQIAIIQKRLEDSREREAEEDCYRDMMIHSAKEALRVRGITVEDLPGDESELPQYEEDE